MSLQVPTYNNQLFSIIEGNDQSGIGGGSVGTMKTMSAATTSYFDTSLNVDTNSVGFRGGVFDGRYIYFVPYSNNNNTVAGQITRFDTTLPFDAPASYVVFDMQLHVNSMNAGFTGGSFDGKYIYYSPNFFGQVVRYDTTTSFNLPSSYTYYDTAENLNSNSIGFLGSIFDGRYIYFVPNSSGQITRYDTTAPFTTASSYELFDAAANLNSDCVGFVSGTFDGRYVYFSPQFNGIDPLGVITRYDTTVAFEDPASYSIFDAAAQVNSQSLNFTSAVFDGKYVYFIPGISGAGGNGQITRFDTAGTFTLAASYSIFDTAAEISSLSTGFIGGNFDGRYLYLTPFMNGLGSSGQITRYDTTQSFFSPSSYSVFDTAAANTLSAGFLGSVTDGRYLYLVPYQNNNVGNFGQITRLDVYAGPLATAIAADQAPNGFAIGSYAGTSLAPKEGLIVSGQASFGTPDVSNSQVEISPSIFDGTLESGLKVAPIFRPTNVDFPSIYGLNLTPQISTVGVGTVGAVYGEALSLNISASSSTVSIAYSLYATGPILSAGSLATAYSLYVTAPIGSITNGYTAYLGGSTGINTPTPKSMLDVAGNLSLGSYAGVTAAPSNGIIVSGKTGIGTSSPLSFLDVHGSAAIGSYAGSIAAPANGLLVSGKVGIGTSSPLSALDINGGATIGSYAGSIAAPSDGLLISGKLGIQTSTPLSALDVGGGVAIGTFAGSVTAPSNGLISSGPVGLGTSAVPGVFFSVAPSASSVSGSARGTLFSLGTLVSTGNDDHLTTIELSETNFATGTSTGLSVSLLDIFCSDSATSGSGTITNAYGIIIRDAWSINATNKFSFYNGSTDPSFFRGPVIFGSAAANNVNIGFGGTFSATNGSSSIGLSIDTIFNPTTTTALYGVSVTPNFIPSSGAIYTTVYGLSVQPVIGGAGSVTNAVGLRVPLPSGAANNYAAFFDAGVGIATATPLNALDVNGGVAIGSYAGNIAAPANGLIISGKAAFGTSSTSLAHLTLAPVSTAASGAARGILISNGALRASANNDELRVFETSGLLFAKSSFTNLNVSLVDIYCSTSSAVGSGSIANAYGLIIHDNWSLAATNKYSFYNASTDPSVFTGGVFFGGAVADHIQVDVGGTFSGSDGTNSVGLMLDMTLNSATASFAFGHRIAPNFAPPSSTTYSTAYALHVQPTVSGVGNVTNLYSLYVPNPTGAANNYTAYFQGPVGINTLIPKNKLDVAGALAIGAYAGNVIAPTNGLIVSGIVGFGTASPGTSAQVVISPSGSSVTEALTLSPTFTPSSGTLTGLLLSPAFNPATGNTFAATYGIRVAPTIAAAGTGTVTTAYGQSLSLNLSAGSSAVSNAYSLNIAGPAISAGTITTAYSLYVTAPSGAGTITNNYTAYLGGTTGINTATPKNMLDVNGNLAVGTYAGVSSAPSNGLIVSGVAGFGTSAPSATSQVSIAPAVSASTLLTALTVSPTFTPGSGTFYGLQIIPAFNPPTGANYTAVYGLNTAPSITTAGTGAVATAYGQALSLEISSSGATVSNAYSLNLSGPSISSGTLTTAYSLYVAAPGGAGSIGTAYSLYVTAPTTASVNYTAYLGGKTGINTSTPMSMLDVSGSMSLGAYAGANAAPANGLIVSGSVGMGTSSPGNAFLSIVPTVTASSGSARGALLSNGTLNASANNDNLRVMELTSTVFAKGTNTSLNVSILDISCNSSSATGSGTIANAYALLIRDGWSVAATNKYSFYNASTDPSFFAGSVNFGAIAANANVVFGGTFSGTDGTTSASLWLNQTLSPPSTTSVYGENISVAFNPPSSNTYTRAIGLNIASTIGGSGTVVNGYGLRIVKPTGASNNYTAWLDSAVGIGTSIPQSTLDISGSLGLGTYAGSVAAPNNSLILSGVAGLGTSAPINRLDVKGGAAFGNYAGSILAPSNGLIVSGSVGIGVSSPINPLDVSAIAIGAYAGNTTAPSNSLIVSGSVGIGIPSPINPLDVASIAIGAYAGVNSAPNDGFIVSGQVGFGTIDPLANQVSIAPSLSGIIHTGLDVSPTYSQSSGTTFTGLNIAPIFGFSANSISNVSNAYAQAITPSFNPSSTSGTLTISNAIGLYIQSVASPGANGAVTNLYGLYVETPTGASNNFSGYFDSAPLFGTPLGLSSGGTNTNTYASIGGAIYYDGTKLAATDVGSSGQVLTSNGPGMSPSFQSAGLSFTTLNLSGSVGSTPPNAALTLETVFTAGTAANLYGIQNLTSFGSLTGTYTNVFGEFTTPLINPSELGAVTNFYGSYIQPQIQTGFFPLENGYGLYLDSFSISGDVNTAYTLFVNDQFNALANYTAILGTSITTRVGIGTTTPAYTLDVAGAISAAKVSTTGLTSNTQLTSLSQGNNQGGFGGGSVGTSKIMRSSATSYFDTAANIQSNSAGFKGAVFDGRYLYFVPNSNNLGTASGQITRYDTTLAFGASASYAAFDLQANISFFTAGFSGGTYDGRYIYFIPNSYGQVVRYDTTTSFADPLSYGSFDTASALNPNSVGFVGAIFDGRYIYFVPNAANLTASGQITRYDTTSSFNDPLSYALFDMQSQLNSNCAGFAGGTYDGRYIYYAPQFNGTASGQIVRYSTTLPFGASSSYAVYDTKANVNSQSVNFSSAVYDGKYVYFIPAAAGLITRYDSTAAFTAASSYTVYNTATQVSSLSQGFFGGSFDGRYLYLTPNANQTFSGQITRFDTTRSFSSTSSYTIFDTAAANSFSKGFAGSIFDGKYLYLVPFQNSSGYFGQITRIEASPGPQTKAIAAEQAPNGFVIGSYAGTTAAPANGLLVSDVAAFGTSSPTTSSQVLIAPSLSNSTRTSALNVAPTYSQSFGGPFTSTLIQPLFSFAANGTTTIDNTYAQQIIPSFTPSSSSGTLGLTNGYGLYIKPTASSGSGGTVSNLYGLYVDTPTGAGANISAYFASAPAFASLTPHGVLLGEGSAPIAATAAGTNGQVLIGSTSADPAFATITSSAGTIVATAGAASLNLDVTGGGLSWTNVTGTSQTIAVNRGYIANNASLVTFTLPANAAIGQIFAIVGQGAGGWTLAQNSGQTIHQNSSSTTTGVLGSVSSTARWNCLFLICTATDTDFVVYGSQGALLIL